ncbi:PREDICTED: muscle-specific protein 20 isoform X1 [Trachymyrmex septentrionalis]|uniref:muscle-specific protein 20 isoform X1 n=1 Tax=Trachymyrmex septentrionalis TaxID=34720 RepID=UPI00084F4A24|nr:PREDICTED: muscle-specific protein 20 isoform X1 [Trachymyrmex septentrionalis]
MMPYSVATRGVRFSFYSTSSKFQSHTQSGKVTVIEETTQQQNAGTRNKEQEAEVLAWIEAVLGEKLPPGNYDDILKDGVILCNLINKLAPGSVKKIQSKGTNFQLMENIQRFQAAIKNYGVPQEEIFQTADLFEKRNIPQVTLCLYALGRLTQKHDWTGPSLGPKMADENKRAFTDDQLRASEGHLGLQMGYNKGASQAGHGGFGNTRHM